jgi:hypothetical protein
VVCRPRGPCVGPKPHPWSTRPFDVLRVRRRISPPLGWCYRAPPSGFSKDRPSIDMTGRCPLPAACGLPRPLPSARRCHASCSFRPRGFSPPRRLPPPAARGLVASHCRPWGSSGFRLDARCAGARGASPPMPHPPEPSPPVQPYPRLREPLPSCRCRLRSRGHRVLLDFKALLRTSSALRGLPLPAGHRPLLSWASRLGASRPSSLHRTRGPPEGGPAGLYTRGPSRGTVRDVHAFHPPGVAVCR